MNFGSFGRITGWMLLIPVVAGQAEAHPVPRKVHDRTIRVRLDFDPPTGQLIVQVDYRLEVDEFTVIFDDLPALGDKADLSALKQPREFYDAFTRLYAPILGANLVATLDGEELAFTCSGRSHQLKDEDGNPLNHLRCDFLFVAKPAKLQAGEHSFTFREGNYEFEEGRIYLSLPDSDSIRYVAKDQPDAALLARSGADLWPGDDAKLRTVTARFVVDQASKGRTDWTDLDGSAGEARLPRLYELFRDRKYNFWLLLLFSAGVGAIHALTPGHGKTLVAAYLVGERGTVFHAVFLGLITTLTHTGVVLALAVALRIWFPQGGMTDSARRNLQTGLQLGGGLLIVCLGLWLLFRRLTGQADHFHLPGHGHHHHSHSHSHDHGEADHVHDEHGRVHLLGKISQPARPWSLVVLGINGGIIPCWDAILMLLLAISANLLWLALPMLLAFSAGLAGVLVLVGVLVVRANGIAGVRWEKSPIFRLLPIVSSVLVTAIGFWLCYDSVHAG